MWTHWGLNWFFLPNPNFELKNISEQNPLQNQYLPHISYKNCEVNYIKSDLLKAFQSNQEHPQISIYFSILIFIEKIV
jgi:hypothetical protein